MSLSTPASPRALTLAELLVEAEQRYATADWYDARGILDRIHELKDELALQATLEQLPQSVKEAA